MPWPTAVSKTALDAGTDDPALARDQLEAAVDAGNDIIAMRGQASGVAELDSAGVLPVSRAPAEIPTLYADTTSTTDVYAISPSPAFTAYTADQRFLVRVHVSALDNTGACTLNVNGLGAKNIKMPNGDDPPEAAIRGKGVYEFLYDGTNMVLLNPSQGRYGLHTQLTVDQLVNSSASNWDSILWNDDTSGVCFDSHDFHDTVTNRDRLTIPSGSGVRFVRICAYISWEDGDGTGRMRITKNGTALPFESRSEPNNSSQWIVTPPIKCAATDYFKIEVGQDSGTSDNIKAGTASYAQLEVLP